MKHSFRRAAAVLLTAALCASTPVSAFADEIVGPGANLGGASSADSGSCSRANYERSARGSAFLHGA